MCRPSNSVGGRQKGNSSFAHNTSWAAAGRKGEKGALEGGRGKGKGRVGKEGFQEAGAGGKRSWGVSTARGWKNGGSPAQETGKGRLICEQVPAGRSKSIRWREEGRGVFIFEK